MEKEDQDSIWFVIRGSINILSAVVILFAAVILFHLYFRCWLLRRRGLLQRQNDAHDIISGHHHHHNAAATVIFPGLDPSAIMSLPTFVYEAKNHEALLECAVCISEFEDNETGRILPECHHRFHVDCIDMWLQSHRDCPLCRARVKGQPGVSRVETSDEVVTSTGSGVVMGPAQSEGSLMGLPSSERTLDAGPTEQHLTKTEEGPDVDTEGGIGPDLELGLSPPNYGTRQI